MGEPDCCLSCKTAASATIGNRPLRIRTVGGVGGRREYPHASYPIKHSGTQNAHRGGINEQKHRGSKLRIERSPRVIRDEEFITLMALN